MMWDMPLMLTLCLEEDSILISEAVLKALGEPKQVQMLINEKQRKLLLQSCTVEEREAVVIPQYYLQFEMSGHSLLKKIRRITGWSDNQPRVIYGDLIMPLNAVIFDLDSAMPAQLQEPYCPHDAG